MTTFQCFGLGFEEETSFLLSLSLSLISSSTIVRRRRAYFEGLLMQFSNVPRCCSLSLSLFSDLMGNIVVRSNLCVPWLRLLPIAGVVEQPSPMTPVSQISLIMVGIKVTTIGTTAVTETGSHAVVMSTLTI